MRNSASIPAQDDGIYVSEDGVGQWSEEKHRLVGLYEALFSTGMKDKWTRVYIDLYAGPGMARVRGTQKFLWGSPLLALQMKNPFDKYVFCENDPRALDALKARVEKHFPNANVCYVDGDCNDVVGKICSEIPQSFYGNGVLSFCFVDPYDLSVKFSTIRKLSERPIDFLMLLALGMDANRNLQHYLDPKNQKLDMFLGLPDWRDKWIQRSSNEKFSFPQFLAEAYSKQMETLQYLPVPFHRMRPVRSDNVRLYHLALFSRNQLAYKYWEEVLKYSTSQRWLF